MKIRHILGALLLILSSTTLHATIIYVDSAHVSGTQNGQSWATAYSNVQTAIDSAHAMDSIWVAKGTYQHYYSSTAFAMKDSVKLFGGFLNTYTSFQSRDWAHNTTVLKGNGYMVILNSFTNVVGPQAWLDGFTVTGGTQGGMENAFSSPTVNNCTFINNTNTSTSATTASAMHNSVCSSIITNCKFISNSGTTAVINGSYGAFPPNANAGPTFVNCQFISNTGNNAGAVSNSGCIVSFTNCDFANNTAAVSGGAMASSQAVVNISNCRFSNNHAGQTGGGIYASKCISTITTSSFTGNSAEMGGGIGNESDTSIKYMNLSYCTFDGNLATNPRGGSLSTTNRFGGGVYNWAKANISYCLFQNNTAGYSNLTGSGGGLYSRGTNTNMISTISNCRFSNNKALLVGGLSWYAANGIGGGAWVNMGNVSECVFEGNEATIRGGGLAMLGVTYQDGVVDRCQFTNNRSQRGGGVFAAMTAAIYNSLIAKNTADSSGGGLEYDVYQGYPAKLVNTTITGNTAIKGGGLYLYAYTAITSTYNISNTIIWGNNNTGIDKLSTIAAPSVTYSLVQGMAANTTAHLLSGSSYPQFVDTAAGNYQLLPASAAVDAGRNDSLSTVYNLDLLNHTRIYNSTIDLGAYEYGIFAPVATLGADTTVCANVPLKLTLPYQAGTAFAWSNGDTTRTTTISAAGKYWVTVSNIRGTASDTIIIAHRAVPIVSLGNDTAVCGLITLNAGNAGASYLWSTNANSQTIQVSPGTYSVAVIDSAGCRSTDTIKVTQLPVPVVNLGNDITLVEGTDTLLDAGNAGATYIWNTGATTRTIRVSAAGVYRVTVTNSSGCSATDAIVISTVPLGIQAMQAGAIGLYPNPAIDAVRISVNDAKLIGSKLILCDVSGKVLRTVVLNVKEQKLSLEGLSAGVYFVRVGAGSAWKLVKQ